MLFENVRHVHSLSIGRSQRDNDYHGVSYRIVGRSSRCRLRSSGAGISDCLHGGRCSRVMMILVAAC